MIQHGAYTMLMDACYDREQFPTIEQAIDWCWASTTEEIEAVNFVLSKFFTKYKDTFKQSHITETLDNYHKNKGINKEIAIKREADKRTKRGRSVDEAITNEHLITNKELRITNQELKIKTRASPFSPPSTDEVRLYCVERGNEVDPDRFVDFYEAKGWMLGKNKMKSWKACVRTWENRDSNNSNTESYGSNAI